MDMVMAIIFGSIIALMLVMALFFLAGRGANLIAGYNTLSDAQRANYDEKALCRFVGWLLIAICASMGIVWAGTHFGVSWAIWVGIALMTALPIAGAVYANTGNRFMKKDAPPEALDTTKKICRRTMIVVGVISAVILIGVGALFVSGEREPRVVIHQDSIRIHAMYGLEVNLANISEITLLEQTMREIGPGRRTNGYATGNTLRGHFTSGTLFVSANSSPTIRIEQVRGPNIYISLRDSQATRALYSELAAAVA